MKRFAHCVCAYVNVLGRRSIMDALILHSCGKKNTCGSLLTSEKKTTGETFLNTYIFFVSSSSMTIFHCIRILYPMLRKKPTYALERKEVRSL